MYLTTDETALFAGIGYLKATLHEIGHSLGLAHLTAKQNCAHGSSVMNKFKRILGGNLLENRDDRGNSPDVNLPQDVTACDEKRALDRSQTP